MNKEVKRIDKKVKAQLAMLDEHEVARDLYYESSLAEENAREKPRKTYLEAINYSLSNSKLITEASRELMLFTTQWNIVKGKLDKAAESEDADAFENHLRELHSIEPLELFKKISRVKMIPRFRKKESPLRTDLLNQYEFMKRVYKNAPKHLNRMRMSPARRRASEQQSLNMKMRWGSY